MARRGQRQQALAVRHPGTSDGPLTVATTASCRCSPAPYARSSPPCSAGGSMPSTCARYQVIALLVREERARVRADQSTTETQRNEALKRLDGIAMILAQTAARDTSLLALLAEDAVVSDAAKSLRRDMLQEAGVESVPDVVAPAEPAAASPATERRVVPQSVVSRQLANPFLAPDFSAAEADQRRAAPAGDLGAARPALQLVRARRRRGARLHAAARAVRPAGAGRPRADAAPGAAGRRRRGRPPHLPARRRARTGQDRRGPACCAGGATPTRCSSSSRTSSRPTGRARPASGRRTARQPWSTATARRSTVSPTSSS